MDARTAEAYLASWRAGFMLGRDELEAQALKYLRWHFEPRRARAILEKRGIVADGDPIEGTWRAQTIEAVEELLRAKRVQEAWITVLEMKLAISDDEFIAMRERFEDAGSKPGGVLPLREGYAVRFTNEAP